MRLGICGTVAEVVTPFLEKEGLKLWDVEFKKEGAEYFLRVYIDRESGVGIEDCVKVNDFLSPALDELDPIQQSYCLEISSAGLVPELKKNGQESSPEHLKEEILKMNIFNSVFVDCTANQAVSDLYEELLNNNVSVVAANKIAASSSYENYIKLKETARHRGIKFLFETNVGAGLPIINTMNDLINSGDHILKLEAVLSGTLNYIFNTLSADIPFSKAIMMAKEEGYSEPDPRIDLSGKDVIRKLVILAREAGYKVEQEDVKRNLFIPESYFEGSLDDFWRNIQGLDARFEEKRQQLEAEDKRFRFVAKMENGACEVGLQEVDAHHPFYELEGSNNIIMISTERYHEYPMIIKGYGAGADVTAAGVFADIISIANIR